MDPSSGADLDVAAVVAKFLLIGAAAGFVFYLYFSITLMVIAQKSDTSGSGLAWLPVFNLFLMCWIGRRSGWWVLAMLIPGVNVVVFALVWASMAAARGKPSWTGPLFLLPGLGMVVPAYLAVGQRRTGGPGPAPGPRSCPRCRAAAQPGERFCGSCGQMLPVAQPGPAPLRPLPLGHAFLVALLMVVLIGGATGAAGWYFLGRPLEYAPPVAQVPPALPAHLAGTLVEFPIDTDPARPARPGSVIAQTIPPPLPPGAPPPAPGAPPRPTPELPPEYLPPGLDREGLIKGATAVTCTPYRHQPEDSPVYVTVCQWPGAEQAGPQLATTVTQTTGGQQTGVRVQSPTGRTYTGSRIRTSQVVVFVLVRPEVDIVIILYAPAPAAAGTAERLAQNVGNGRGLLDDPGVRSTIGVLPARPPGDLQLQQVRTLTPEDMLPAPGPAGPPPAGGRDAEEARRLEQQMQQFVPQRLTAARYANAARPDWGVILCEFESPRQAFNCWMVARWLLQMAGMTTTPVQGTTGLVAVVEKTDRVLLFWKGPYIVLLLGPAEDPGSLLVQLADGLQI